MKREVLYAIKNLWFLPFLDNLKMRDVFKRIYVLFNTFEIFEIEKGDTIGLYGNNSFNWIIIYLTALIKGISIVIIHPNLKPLEVAHISLLKGINFLFIDKELLNEDLSKNIFLNTIIMIDPLEVVFERNNKHYYKNILSSLVEAEDSLRFSEKELYDFIEKNEKGFNTSTITTATSGTENGLPKWVEVFINNVKSMVTMAREHLPFEELDKVYVNIPFAESHFLSVLLPTIKRCNFVGDPRNANVFIENTNTFENTWREIVDDIYTIPIISFLLTFPSMKWLFKRLAIYKMKKHYGKNIKSIIIYNSTVNEEIMSTLVGSLPIYTTYGSQETIQLVAINDYKTSERRKPFCVGRLLSHDIVCSTVEDVLELNSPALFNKYVGDKFYTREVKFNDNYVTGDIGFLRQDTRLLYIYGRQSAILENEFKLPIQADKIERILKAIPYIKELIIYSDREDHMLNLLVYPNTNFVEAKGIGLVALKSLLLKYLDRINKILENNVQIKNIFISDYPLQKTTDDKICRYYYS